MSGSVIKNAMVDLRRMAVRNEKRRRPLAAIAGACSVASTILTLLSDHVSRAQRSTSRAFTPVFAGYGGALQTPIWFTRDRRPYARKSGKPDLRGPFQSVAVPDQRCIAPLRYALHRVRDTR